MSEQNALTAHYVPSEPAAALTHLARTTWDEVQVSNLAAQYIGDQPVEERMGFVVGLITSLALGQAAAIDMAAGMAGQS